MAENLTITSGYPDNDLPMRRRLATPSSTGRPCLDPHWYRLWPLLALVLYACGTSSATPAAAASPDGGADAPANADGASADGPADASAVVNKDVVSPEETASSASDVGDSVDATAPCANGCDDGNPCTADVCKLDLCQHNAIFQAPCDDGNPCTQDDSCHDGTCQGGPATTWQWLSGLDVDDSAQAVIAVENDIIAAGWTTSADQSHQALLVRVTAQTKGATKPVWLRTYGGKNIDEFQSVIATSTGYVAVGSTSSQGAGLRDGWLVTTDLQGNLLTEQTFGGPKDEELFAAVTTTDGYALAGYSESQGSDDPDAYLVRCDWTGKLTWTASFGTTALDAFYGLVRLDDGFVIVGETSPGGSEHLWLVRTDNTGKLLWEHSFHGTGSDTGWSLIATNNGLFAGGYEHPDGQPTRAWLTHAALDGSLVDETDLGPGELFGLVGTPAGLAWTGVTDTGQFKPLAVGLLDAQGKSSKINSFGGVTGDGGHAIAQFPDGHLAIAGRKIVNNQMDAWILRTQGNGAQCP